jgi:hypothetical protein
MNELAQVVHDLVTRGLEPTASLHSELSSEERAALEDLRAFLTKSPADLAARLVELGPTAEWYSPPRSTGNPAQP